MITNENEVDRSTEHDPILERFWEIDKQANQAKDNIKRIIELENAIKFSLDIIKLWGIPIDLDVKPEYETEAQALCLMENKFREALGQNFKPTEPNIEIELPF